MKARKKILLPLFLFLLFTVYHVSITMFTHVHYVNGVMIVHSHPFGEKSHTHSKTTLLLLDRLSTFYSLEPLPNSIQSVYLGVLWLLQPDKLDSPFSIGYTNSTTPRAPPSDYFS